METYRLPTTVRDSRPMSPVRARAHARAPPPRATAHMPRTRRADTHVSVRENKIDFLNNMRGFRPHPHVPSLSLIPLKYPLLTYPIGYTLPRGCKQGGPTPNNGGRRRAGVSLRESQAPNHLECLALAVGGPARLPDVPHLRVTHVSCTTAAAGCMPSANAATRTAAAAAAAAASARHPRR